MDLWFVTVLVDVFFNKKRLNTFQSFDSFFFYSILYQSCSLSIPFHHFPGFLDQTLALESMYRYHHCSRTTYLWDEWTQRHFTRWLESTWTSRPLRLLKKNGPLKTILLVLRCSPRWKIPRVFDANEQNFATSQLIFSYSARDPPWRFAISMQHSEQWNGSASRLPLEDTWHIIYTYHVSSFFDADSTWSNRYVCFLFTYSII